MNSSLAKTNLLLSEFDKELEGFDSAVSSFTSSSKSYSSKSSYSSMTNSDGVTIESEENHEAQREVNAVKRSGEEAQICGYESESHNKASWDSRTGETQSECSSSSNKLGNVERLCIEDNIHGLITKMNSDLKCVENIDESLMAGAAQKLVSGSVQERRGSSDVRQVERNIMKNDSCASVLSQASTVQSECQNFSQSSLEESCIDTEQRSFQDVKKVFAQQHANLAANRSTTLQAKEETRNVHSTVEESSIDTEQRSFQDAKKVFAQQEVRRASPEQSRSPPTSRPIIDTVDLLPREIEDEIVMLENIHPFSPNDIEIILNAQTRKITLEAHREEKTSDGGSILHSVSRYWMVPTTMDLGQMKCFVNTKGQLILSTRTTTTEITRIQIVNEGSQRQQQQRTETAEIVEEVIRPSDVRRKFEKIAEQEKASAQKKYIKINPSSSPVLPASQTSVPATPATPSCTDSEPATPKTHLTTATMFVSAPQERAVKEQQERSTMQQTAERSTVQQTSERQDKQMLQQTLQAAKQSVASVQDMLSERLDRRALEEEMRSQSHDIVSNQSQISTGRSTYDFMAECESEFRRIQQNAERAMQMNFSSFLDDFDADMRIAALDSRRVADSFFDDYDSELTSRSRSLRSRSALERAHFGSLFHDIDTDSRVQRVEHKEEALKFTVNVGACREDQLRVKLIESRLVLEAEWEEGYSRRSIRREWALPTSIAPEQIKCTLSSDGVLVITCGN